MFYTIYVLADTGQNQTVQLKYELGDTLEKVIVMIVIIIAMDKVSGASIITIIKVNLHQSNLVREQLLQVGCLL